MDGRRGWTAIATIAALVVGLGCGGDDGTPMPDGGGLADGGWDAGTDAGVAGDGGWDAGLGGPGAACDTGDDCESGLCVNPAAIYDLGTGYCTEPCSEDTDCTLDDGYEYSCLEVRGTSQCVRTCHDGFGCPETDACLNDWNLGGVAADTCLDMSDEVCTADSECADTEQCMPVIGDREKILVACWTPLGTGGVRLEDRLQTGEACDQRSNINGEFAVPCEVADDCPEGWRCLPRQSDDRRVCTPPEEETCMWYCGPGGVCGGICGSDDDCPTDMRCSRFQYPALNHGTPSAHDDVVWDHGQCRYAAGSRTPCVREADCASTGAGGSRETCMFGPDSTGANAPICVTPVAGAALPGEACGDDPTTDAFEVRPCLSGCVADRCSARCDGDDDCDAGSSCVELPYDADSFETFCYPDTRCAAESDCATGETCLPFYGSDGAIDTCAVERGTLAPGDTCEVADGRFLTVAERCSLGCADVGEGPSSGRCTAVCSIDSDCPTDFICSSYRQAVRNRGTLDDRSDDLYVQRGICIYVPGSSTSCTTDAACPTGERCVHSIDSSGAEQRTCVTEVDGGRETGEFCSDTLLCANRAGCFNDWFAAGERYCTELCESDTDCPTELSCRRFTGGPDPDVTPTLCMRPEDPRGEAL